MRRDRFLLHLLIATVVCQSIALVVYELWQVRVFKEMVYVALGISALIWLVRRFGPHGNNAD